MVRRRLRQDRRARGVSETPWDISLYKDGVGYFGGQAVGAPAGGSLPDWWTVDSTPGAESVTFGGSVIVASDDPDAEFVLKVVGAEGSGEAFSSLFVVRSDVAEVCSIDGGGDFLVNLRPGGSEFTISTQTMQPFKVKDNNTIGFWGSTPTTRKTLDPATCTAEDIANALIASTFMAAA